MYIHIVITDICGAVSERACNICGAVSERACKRLLVSRGAVLVWGA
jgi:hypothetical protein